MNLKTLKPGVFYFVMIWACLLVLPLNTKAQSEPYDIGVEGSVWYFSQNYTPFGPGNPYYIQPLKITYLGDTTIQDKICQVLFMEAVDQPIPTSTYLYAQNGYIYLHNDAGLIYYFDHLADSFRLSIDFNAGPGDSWHAELPCGDPSLIWDSVMHIGYTPHEIIQTDWLETASAPLKILKDNVGWQFIERIGMPDYFLPYPAQNCGHLSHENDLYICSYYDPEVGLIKFGDYDCETTQIVTNVNNPNSDAFHISPNPAMESFRIKGSVHTTHPDFTVHIYNAAGSLVLFVEKPGEQIDISGLTPGFYLVQIKSANDLFVPQKLIIHH